MSLFLLTTYFSKGKLHSRQISVSSYSSRTTDSADDVDTYKKRVCKSLADPEVFAQTSDTILKQLEEAKETHPAIFIDVLYTAISNELILPIARFQALFYLKLATERQSSDTGFLRLISGNKQLLDTLQQQCLFDRELPVSSRGRTFFTEKQNEALGVLGLNYMRLLLEMVNFWGANYGNLTELVPEGAKVNSFRQLYNTLTLVYQVEFPKDYYFYKIIDWNRLKHVDCRAILGQLTLSNTKLKYIKEKLEELMKYIIMLKEDYLSFKKKPSSIQLVSLTGKYSRIHALQQELQQLAGEAKFIPENDTPVLLEELHFLLKEAEYMYNDFQLFFTQKITAQEHTSKMVELFSNKEIASPLAMLNGKDPLESATMNVQEKVSQLRTVSEFCGMQRQSSLKSLTLMQTKAVEESFSTLADLETRGSRSTKSSKFSRANVWLQENYKSYQLVSTQIISNRSHEKQHMPTSRLYSARDKTTGENLAIKVISFPTAELYDRACSAVMSMMKLQNHKNVMQIKDLIFDSDKLEIGYGTPLGRNLEAVLDGDENSHTMKPERAISIVKELVGCILYAQECGIYHKNIKSSNIVETSGSFKLCDWGMSWHILELDRMKTTLEGPKDRVYCAPELVGGSRGEGNGTKGEVFSLGMILLRLLWADILKIEELDRTEESSFERGISEIIHELSIKTSVKEILKKTLRWNPQNRLGLEDLQNQLNKLR